MLGELKHQFLNFVRNWIIFEIASGVLSNSLQMCIISFFNKKGKKYCFLTITAKSEPRNAVKKTEMSKWVCFCIKERLFIVNLAIKPRSLPALLLCYCYSWTILKRKVARAKGFKKWIVLVWQQWWGWKHEMSHLRRAEMNRGEWKIVRYCATPGSAIYKFIRTLIGQKATHDSPHGWRGFWGR